MLKLKARSFIPFRVNPMKRLAAAMKLPWFGVSLLAVYSCQRSSARVLVAGQDVSCSSSATTVESFSSWTNVFAYTDAIASTAGSLRTHSAKPLTLTRTMLDSNTALADPTCFHLAHKATSHHRAV